MMAMYDELSTTRTRTLDRPTQHKIARLARATTLELAHVHATEVIEVAKLEAADTVTNVAMSCIAQQALVEAWHVNRTPHAAGRLSLVADEYAVGAAHRVRRLAREL
jgi:hypothetical protein